VTEKQLLRRVMTDPRIMFGKPVIRGTRLPVDMIVEKVAYGATLQDLQRDYPFIRDDDVKAALLYAAKCVRLEEIFAA
jgi:uncharacterized protein (DUF433 family)